MFQYTYKEFNVSYDITFSSDAEGYEAYGCIKYIENDKNTFSQEFRTANLTYNGAENSIKKLMEDFIDFEWQQVAK